MSHMAVSSDAELCRVQYPNAHFAFVQMWPTNELCGHLSIGNSIEGRAALQASRYFRAELVAWDLKTDSMNF